MSSVLKKSKGDIFVVQYTHISMLALVVTFFGYSLPLDPKRAQPSMPPAPGRVIKRMHRRAPLAEHGWEERVLRNLTQSE